MRKRFLLWCFIFFLPVAIVILRPALYTLYVDPLWQWNHPFHKEAWHSSFNERMQKTNWLASRRPKIDTLIIGSSRSSYMNPELLESQNAFNYAVSSGEDNEFAEHIIYVRKRSHLPLKFVLVEASFGHCLMTKSQFKLPCEYENDAENFSKRIDNLFSKDANEKAHAVLSKPKHAYYFVKGNQTRSYRYSVEFSSVDKRKEIASQLETYKNMVYPAKFDEGYGKNIANIHKAIGETKYAVWTAPLSKYQLQQICKTGHMGDYERWLKILVAEFGEVYNFCYPSEFTMNDANFIDSHHMTVASSNVVVDIISGRQKPTVELCTIVTKANIDSHLAFVKKRLEELSNQPNFNRCFTSKTNMLYLYYL